MECTSCCRRPGKPGSATRGLVPEPVAAATHFAAVTGGVVKAPLAVYDLGAGTFDVAVVGGATVLAEGGLADLGGLDVDQALLDDIGRQVSERDPGGWQRLLRPESTADRRAARALREDVRAAKESLSDHPRTEVRTPMETPPPGIPTPPPSTGPPIPLVRPACTPPSVGRV